MNTNSNAPATSVVSALKSVVDAVFRRWKGSAQQPQTENRGPDFQLFPFGLKYTHLNHEVIHKELYSAKTLDSFRPILAKFETPHDAWNFNHEWLFANCRASQVILFALAADVNPEDAEQRLISSGRFPRFEKTALIMSILPHYKDERYANYLAIFYKRNEKDLSFSDLDKDAIISMKDEGAITFLRHHLPSLALQPKDFNAMHRYRHTDYSHWYTYENSSLLGEAVENNDLPFAAFLLDHGADPNQFLMESIMRSDKAIMKSNPVLLKIRSAEMINLFVKHGLDFYPWSGYVRDGIKNEKQGFRNNLLETLWRECESTTAIQKLYDTLYRLHYDEPSKLRMGQLIKQYSVNKAAWKGGNEFEQWVKKNGGTIS